MPLSEMLSELVELGIVEFQLKSSREVFDQFSALENGTSFTSRSRANAATSIVRRPRCTVEESSRRGKACAIM